MHIKYHTNTIGRRTENVLMVIFLFCCVVSSLNAQDYRNYIINIYQDKDGLPHNSTKCLLQDKFGFVWIGTRNGLCCFDGKRNIPLKISDNNLGNVSIHSLFEDKLGRIWMGTDYGVYVYDRIGTLEKFDKITRYSVSISSEVSKIVQLDSNKILVATMGQGYFVYNVDSDVLEQYNSHYSFILDVYTNGKDLYLTTLQEQFLHFDLNGKLADAYNFSENRLNLETPLLTNRFICKGKNSLWIGGGDTNDLFEFYPQSGDIVHHKLENATFKSVKCIIPLGNEELLLGTNKGLYIFTPHDEAISEFEYSEKVSIYNLDINELVKDNEGGIWVLTEHSGVMHISPRNKRFYNHNIPGNYMVNAFCQGMEDNTILVGSQNGLYKYDIEKNLLEESPSGTNLKYDIRSLCRNNNELWIGTLSDGVIVMDLTTGKTKHYVSSFNSPNTITSNNIKKILRTKGGDIIIGTNWGVCYYDKKHDNFRTETILGAMMAIADIYEDGKNNIWFATDNGGVYRHNLNTQTWRYYKHNPENPYSLPNNSVIKIFEDKEGKLILSTNGNGLCLFDYDKDGFIGEYGRGHGLHSNIVVNSMEQDMEGKLWLSTNSGLCCLNTNDSLNHTHFTSLDGLQRNFFCESASYTTKNGTLMFGGSNGFNVFNPLNFKQNKFIPPVYITDINFLKVKENAEKEKIIGNDKPLYLSGKIRIPHSYNSFTVHFASLSYVEPEKNLFSYKMEGLDKSWMNQTKSNSVTYTNLAPGKYCLYVKGSNNDQVWNDKVAKLQIIITPPWYLSVWAYCAYSILTISMLTYLLIKRDRHLKKRYNLRMERFKEEKERELYKNKINFFINLIHEIKTPLTLIKLPLDNLMKDSAVNSKEREYLSVMSRNVNYLIGVTNELLDFQKIESGEMKLNFETTDIGSLIKVTYEQFIGIAEIKNINLQNDVGADFQHEIRVDKDKIRKILVNLLSNAMKYAEKSVVLSSNVDGDYVNIYVADDGPGIDNQEKEKVFQVFYQSKGEKHQPGTGIGLAYARTLAENHHGKLYVQDNEQGGTTFVLSLPLYKNELIPEDERLEVLSDSAMMNDKEAISNDDVLLQQNHIVLLVEDNPDLLKMESANLKKWFKILKAKNGEQALKIIDNHDVDIIVSDVMMPVMDGLELCQRVKDNIEYSHIPVILLTAKTLPKSKTEGFCHGADAYVEKPFTILQLCMQIRNLLRLRRSLQKRIQPLANIENNLHPTEAFFSNKDMEFLKMLKENISNQLSDENFSIDSLTAIMNMSRSNFYRKLKALTGMSPNEYLKNCRLNRAAELLKEGYRITEIFEQTGFCSSSYFAKCFKAKFGVLPKDFQNNKEVS